jgi:hypothetical protein
MFATIISLITSAADMSETGDSLTGKLLMRDACCHNHGCRALKHVPHSRQQQRKGMRHACSTLGSNHKERDAL